MRDLSQAARGLREWSELLEEKPNAVIFGRDRRMKRALSIAARSLVLGGAARPSDPPPLLLTLPSSALPAAPRRRPRPRPSRARWCCAASALPEYLLSRRVRYRDSASSLAEWPNT